MPKATYYSPDFPEGITRTEFRRLRREQKIEVMRAWFGQHYEDPVHRTPYQTAEGGYQWIYGGPFYAHEELMSEFEGLASEKMINDLVEELEHECTEWTSAPDKDDYYDEGYVPVGIDDIVDGGDKWPPLILSGGTEQDKLDGGMQIDPLDVIANKISFGLVPRYGNPDELAARAAIIRGLEQIEAELDQPAHSGSMIGHNHPPEPIEANTNTTTIAVAVAEDNEKRVKDAVAVLKSELKSDKPDAAEVVSKTRVLRDVFMSIAKWAGKKADLGVDEFIKSYMKAAGAAAGVATIPISIAGAMGKLGDVASGIASVYSGIVDWLQMVMSVPF